MTAWLPTSQGLSVVTPNDPPENVPLVRWNVDAKTAPVNAANGSQLGPNQYLDADHQIAAGGAHPAMQGDGNLVLYRDSGGVIWASDTDGTPAIRAYLQYDGNLVLLTAGGGAV